MSYPPYQQSATLQEEDLQQIANLLADDDVFSSLLVKKLSAKIYLIVKTETDKLRSRIELLEHENLKLRQKLGVGDHTLKSKEKGTQGSVILIETRPTADKQILKTSEKDKVQVSCNGARAIEDKNKNKNKSDVKKEGYGQNPPYGGTPYPTTQNSSAPYPTGHPPYTNQSGIFPPSLGFKVDAPIFMPTPGYPPAQSNSPYPNTFSYSSQSNTPSYPPVQGNTYPPPQSSKPSYPPQGSSSPYPPQGSSSPYPPQGRAPYPNTSSVYRSGSTASASYPSSTNYGSAHVGSSYPSTHHHASYSSGSISQHVSAPSKTGYPPGGSYQTNTTTYSSNTGHVSPIRKMTPTVVPMNPFNARGDAEILRKAMKGFGTDEKAIISVVTRRSNAQRLQITLEFKTLYGKDLIKDLKSETSGKFEDLLVALMTPLPQYYAKELHDAISGLGTDEDVLIEVLCTKSNNEIRTIRAAYHSMYGRSLEDDLIGDTSGTFKRLMVSLCNACRDESTGTNPAAAAKDAQDLLRAGELKLGTDESTFNMILCQRSYAQLRLIFEEYYRITGHDFENAIKNEFSGNSKEGLLAIVRSIRNLPGFFAKCLHSAIAGLGTNDRQLIRVIVTRCEIDMGEIKQNYLAQYGETLADAIKGDTSGDYKKCLFALIGES